MIGTILRINWFNLLRDRIALGLMFILPIIFFTIFAFIFGGMSKSTGSGPTAIRIAVVDEDQTDISRRFIKAIDDQDALITVPPPSTVASVPLAPGSAGGSMEGGIEASGDQGIEGTNPSAPGSGGGSSSTNPPPPDPSAPGSAGAAESPSTAATPPLDRASARLAVREGKYKVALIIPQGFSRNFGSFVGDRASVQLIYDEADPIARFSVSGLMQAAAMMAAPDILMKKGMEQLDRFGGGMTPRQSELINEITPFLRGDRPWEELEAEKPLAPGSAGGSTEEGTKASGDQGVEGTNPLAPGSAGGSSSETSAAPKPLPPGSAGGSPSANPTAPSSETGTGFSGMVHVEEIAARADEGPKAQGQGANTGGANMIAYYAAGIGVMFLLFSMAGASGFLLEQEEYGVLERLLTSNISMGTLLLGNWLFFSLAGMVQLALMFLYAALVFNLDLFSPNHLAGCIIMVIVTAPAAAAFGVILATLARSRAQLGGMSTIIILIMSALGGSMMPKFVAPAVFDLTSKFTFNGWAIDGFLKVFWNDDPNASLLESTLALWPFIAVLCAMTIAFLLLARLAARTAGKRRSAQRVAPLSERSWMRRVAPLSERS